MWPRPIIICDLQNPALDQHDPSLFGKIAYNDQNHIPSVPELDKLCKDSFNLSSKIFGMIVQYLHAPKQGLGVKYSHILEVQGSNCRRFCSASFR